MKQLLLSLVLIAFIPSFIFAQSNNAYREKILIVKVKPAFADAFSNGDFSAESIAGLQAKLGVDALFQKFPKAQKPSSNQRNAQDPFADRQVDITRVYEWKYTADISVPKAVIAALKSGLFEYAEPAYIYEISFVPSDELAYKQYHLDNIRAYEAFDIDTGSADVT
ncbi:MAG: extracellular solute-binding protein, partial [Salibacteraceae bacterium]|nr:extracellular solute-binding protein [Salibacteraceae bacterium]